MSSSPPPDPPPAPAAPPEADGALRTELVLVVRQPPGRGHLYRFAGDRVTVGREPTCSLCIDDPEVEPVHLVFERTATGYRVGGAAGVAVSGEPLAEREARPVGTADAIELGGRLIELAVERGPAPTTDRQDGGRLMRSFEAERHVRAVGGPSLWVLRGGAAGAAMPVPFDGLRCGSGPDDGLALPDEGVVEGHFTVRTTGEGDVWLTARAPVRVRGLTVREARLGPGDLVFVGDAICEVRVLEQEAELARAAQVPRIGWPVVLAGGLAVACLAVAWWMELR